MEDGHFLSFDSDEEMFSYLEEQNKKAKEIAEQMNAKEIIPKYKCWAMYEKSEDLVIVGKRWEPKDPDNPTEAEQEDLESVNNSIQSGWIFARWYSFFVPEGELGDNHISHCYPIPEFLFDFCLQYIQGE